MKRKLQKQFKRAFCLTLMVLFGVFSAVAQSSVSVKGVVVDSDGQPVIGATVALNGNYSVGTFTDATGSFVLNVPSDNVTLTISFLGMKSQEVQATSSSAVRVVLEDDSQQLEEIIVVGYGQQKKASVVGAITQTSGEVLERAAGVSDLGAALTGNLPGVITMQSSGMPGQEEPQIVIRGASSWNNSDPLVMVDGVERPMSSVDVSSVESISVLKDASATAVYGVKGANGVILITTKRGKEGAAQINVGFTSTIKTASKLPDKMDSYDALMAKNRVIENELSLVPNSFADYTPHDIALKYRYPSSLEESERYPNVDWEDVLFKDYAMSYTTNVSVSGGTKFVKYYAAADYVNEGDLFKDFDNGRGYDTGFGYNRMNVRSNLDFTLTPTTTFKMNIAGSSAATDSPWEEGGVSGSFDSAFSSTWAGIYSIAPDVFLPIYSDGSYGYYPLDSSNVTNSVRNLTTVGSMTTTTTNINTDFTLIQDLSVITKGLSARAMVSWDNVFVEVERGITDRFNDPVLKWIDPDTGLSQNREPLNANSGFDYAQGNEWSTDGGEVQNWRTQRHLNYQGQLNWARTFGLHDLSATGVFTRQESAYGSEIPRYREDWVFRATYGYDNKYMVEYNGAYNGSEKFDEQYRFGFFNSGAVGWVITEEKFMNFLKERRIVDMLKIRASYGEIGDDSGSRHLYMTQWAYGGTAPMLTTGLSAVSPYTFYYEDTLGNPNVTWEKVTKQNLGIDYSVLGGLFAGSLEFFNDYRTDILVTGSDRSTPSYFGSTAPTANLGEAESKGYELELRFNKVFQNGLRLWANTSMTHAENTIIIRDDPALIPAYQKDAGYSIGQQTSYIDGMFLETFDQVYGSPTFDTNEDQKLPGSYYIVDFNGDGIIDTNDQVPYGYSSTPQNTYNATIGFEWKGFSAFAQFYGVTNVTRQVDLASFPNNLNTVYDNGTWWSPGNSSADFVMPRWLSTQSYNEGTQYMYDASYVRLKNVEVAYTWNSGWVKKIGVSNLKLFVNGNNVWLWSRMPDDRESNFSGSGGSGAYPTLKRYNIGLKLTL